MTDGIVSFDLLAAKRKSAWQAFKPLMFGVLASSLLLTWDAYRRTTIRFEISVDLGNLSAPKATVDGIPYVRGRWLPPGHRKLVLRDVDTDPVEREFFLWPGVKDLGRIELQRSRGAIEVKVRQSPLAVAIVGEFLTNSSNANPARFDSLPFGRYQVTVSFPYSVEVRQVELRSHKLTRLDVKGAVGALEIATLPSDAEFNLHGWFAIEINLSGKTPTVVDRLPTGQYLLRVSRQDYSKELRVDVRLGETNQLNIAFDYAELSVATEPAGATIFLNESKAGETPRTITELRPGRYSLRLEREGFLSVATGIEVKGNESIMVATNLISTVYIAAMENARRFGNGVPPDFDRALSSLEEALKTKPEDREATELKEKFLRARAGAIEQKQAAESAARRQAVLDKFQKAIQGEKDGEYFDVFTWSFDTQVIVLKEALLRSLQREPVFWVFKEEAKLPDETFLITCVGKGPLGKYRHASILLAQFSPREVIVHAKFWDYRPRQGQELGFLIRGREALLPYNPKFVAEPNLADEVEAKRKSTAEEFKVRMQKELN